ncbi:MAG: Flp family type IVb pilin [Mycobacteriales bacterium]|nr:MAG: hypothetical protein DLM56_00540 [Pseudonocardiales bacterium]
MIRSELAACHLVVAFIRTRLEPLRKRSERGASAVEWAIIAAITVALAILIGGLIIKKVNQQQSCINGTQSNCTGK